MSQIAKIKILKNTDGSTIIYPRTTAEAVYGLENFASKDYVGEITENMVIVSDDATQAETQNEYLKYTPQTFTDAQKAQARSNIGAVSTGEFNTLSNNVAMKTHLCNPNLLDNWYFRNPVNQRGLTSYTGAGYTIDRWRSSHSATSVSLDNNGINLTTTAQWATFEQKLENPDLYKGKTLTASVLVDSAIAGSYQLVIHGENSLYGIKSISSTSGLYTITWTVPNGIASLRTLIQATKANAGTIAIKAVKLELGSEQTLAHQENGVWVLNEIPNYADELAKCSQYNPTTGTYGGPHTMVKLWENASPSSEFGAQTVSIPTLFDYDFIFITTITSAAAVNSGQYQPTVYIPVLVGAGAAISSFSSGGSDMWGHCRTVTIASNGVTFGNGHQVQFGGSIYYNWPGRAVPTAIYGIKGVL